MNQNQCKSFENNSISDMGNVEYVFQQIKCGNNNARNVFINQLFR